MRMTEKTDRLTDTESSLTDTRGEGGRDALEGRWYYV